MKTLTTILLLALTLSTVAAETDSKPNTNPYVADDLEIVTLPNGELIPRLISRSGLIPRQYWRDSVYPQGSITVFQGRGKPAQGRSSADRGQERRIPQIELAPNDMPEFVTQEAERK